MNKKESLQKLIDDFGVHTLAQLLNIDYNDLITRNKYNYEDKINENGVRILLENKELKNHILDWIFPFEANGLTLNQDYFLTDSKKAYEQLLMFTDTEEKINEIFSKSSNILSNEVDDYQDYRNKYSKFLSHVITQSKSKIQLEKMLNDFIQIKKSDKTELFPIINAFLAKRISADKVYESIKDLNNSYLEARMVDYLVQNQLPFSFKVKQIEMYEEQEKIIYEKSLKFNTNYFMKLGIKENKVLESLECFINLICNVDEIDHILKKKDKSLTLIIRSENEEKISKIYEQIKEHSNLITEFVQGYQNDVEYLKRFMTYWHLNKQFSPKSNTVKNKI